jgi:hypothetical protein
MNPFFYSRSWRYYCRKADKLPRAMERHRTCRRDRSLSHRRHGDSAPQRLCFNNTERVRTVRTPPEARTNSSTDPGRSIRRFDSPISPSWMTPSCAGRRFRQKAGGDHRERATPRAPTRVCVRTSTTTTPELVYANYGTHISRPVRTHMIDLILSPPFGTHLGEVEQLRAPYNMRLHYTEMQCTS